MRRFLVVVSLLSVPLLIDFLISIFFLTITGSGAGTGAAAGIEAFEFWESVSCKRAKYIENVFFFLE